MEGYTRKDVQKMLAELGEEEYRKFHSGLLPGVDHIIGVRLPKLRRLAREIGKSNWEQWIEEAEDTWYEEKMIHGLVIGYGKMDWDKREFHIRQFVPQIDNWAVCDSFCNTLKCTEKNKKKMWELLDSYVNSGKEYQERFVAVMLLSYYVEENYLEEALKRLSDLKNEGYYTKMAVAWALSVYFVKFPRQIMEYLEKLPKEEFIYKKTLQKIMESYRVDDQWKSRIKQMRQKG